MPTAPKEESRAEPYEKMEHGTKAVCGRAGGAGGADGKDKGTSCWTQALEEDEVGYTIELYG